MPKPKRGPRLGGGPSHQRQLLAGQASDLFRHGRIRTTEAKAKQLRPYAEKLITKAKRGDLHARRQVLSKLRDRDVVAYLFEDVAPRFEDRNGGYTRILKLGPRAGDNAPMALIELVDQGITYGHEEIEEAKRQRSRGLFGRLRRGRDDDVEDEFDLDDLEDEDLGEDDLDEDDLDDDVLEQEDVEADDVADDVEDGDLEDEDPAGEGAAADDAADDAADEEPDDEPPADEVAAEADVAADEPGDEPDDEPDAEEVAAEADDAEAEAPEDEDDRWALPEDADEAKGPAQEPTAPAEDPGEPQDLRDDDPDAGGATGGV